MTNYSNRLEVPEKEKWNLGDIYQSLEKWEQDYKRTEEMIGELASFNGNIQNGKTLLDYLEKTEKMDEIFTLVYVYAMLKVDLDTRDTDAQSLLDRASQLAVKINAATSFFFPYLLSIEEDVLEAYIQENEGLKYFEKDLFEIYRYKKHVLSKEQEEILSQMGEAFSAPRNTFNMLDNADIQFGEVTNDNGENVELTRGMYSKWMEDENREKRQEAYKAHYKPYLQLKNSFASTLSANIKNNVLLARIKNYPTALEKSLFGDLVPKEVYENLISATKKNIDALHTYNAIRKEQLGVEELKPYDLSVSLVEGVKTDITYEQAYETMISALAPLGEEYIDILQSFKDKRYVDVRETPGKRSGAYNLGLFGIHPFILLNHQNDLDSLFTLVHEMGHAMHSHYSSNYQPRISAGYSIFVAEVASTVNEVLLIRYLLNNAIDSKLRKYLINHFVDQFKGTYFTQIMFAEFEKITHELAEKGNPLNAEVFNQIYGTLSREYNGEVLIPEEETSLGWARIPHFYRPFYVYQYATGFASALHIADQLLKGDTAVRESYINFLKSGSSDYPLELLKKTGVDLTTSEPIDNALRQFRGLIEELKNI